MVITYYGASCFKVQSGETVLVFDPPAKDSKFKSPRFQANVVFVNTNSEDYNGWENITAKVEGKDLFVVDGPGEYEIGDIFVKGFNDGVNAVYFVQCEGISLCHTGALETKELNAEAKEAITGVDILFVPVRNEEDIQSVATLIGQIEPKIIIPMHYEQADLKKFLKEEDSGDIKPIDKFTFKKKELEGKKAEIVVLEAAL